MSKIYLYSYFPIYSFINFNRNIAKNDMRASFIHSLMLIITLFIILHYTQLIYYIPRNIMGALITIALLCGFLYLDYRNFIINNLIIEETENRFFESRRSKRIMVRLLGAILIFYTFLGAPVYLFIRILLLN